MLRERQILGELRERLQLEGVGVHLALLRVPGIAGRPPVDGKIGRLQRHTRAGPERDLFAEHLERLLRVFLGTEPSLQIFQFQ